MSINGCNERSDGALFGNLGRTRQTLRASREAPMVTYDGLPAELRAWLQQAALPWSPASARRAYRRALMLAAGDRQRAIALLSRMERRKLARDPPADGTLR